MRGTIATDGYDWASLGPQVADTFRITATEDMGPRIREDDGGVFVAPLAKIFEFEFQTATRSRSRAAARVELLVFLPSALRGDGAPKDAPW
jgi:hypothetical protein